MQYNGHAYLECRDKRKSIAAVVLIVRTTCVMALCLCTSLCHRMSVFVEKARKMGRSVSLIAQLDRYIECISVLSLQ